MLSAVVVRYLTRRYIGEYSSTSGKSLFPLSILLFTLLSDPVLRSCQALLKNRSIADFSPVVTFNSSALCNILHRGGSTRGLYGLPVQLFALPWISWLLYYQRYFTFANTLAYGRKERTFFYGSNARLRFNCTERNLLVLEEIITGRIIICVTSSF